MMHGGWCHRLCMTGMTRTRGDGALEGVVSRDIGVGGRVIISSGGWC